MSLVPVISIENFNENAKALRLTSPRSIEACAATGIHPSELLKKGPDSNEVLEVLGEVDADEDSVKMVVSHMERRRRQKLKTVRQSRLKLIKRHREEDRSYFIEKQEKAKAQLEAEVVDMKKMIERERKQMEAIIAQNEWRQKMEVKFRTNMQRVKQIQQQKDKEKQHRAREYKDQQERIVKARLDRTEYEKQQARKTAQQAYKKNMKIKAQQDALELARKQDAKKKEQERLEKQIRFKQSLQKKREEADRKALVKAREMMERDIQRKNMLESQRRMKREKTRAKMAAKAALVSQVKQSQEDKQKKRRQAWVDSQTDAEKRLRRRQREKREAEEKKRKKLIADEERRKNALKESQKLNDQRINKIIKKRAAIEARNEWAMKRRNMKAKDKALKEKLLSRDRNELVRRKQRVREHDNERLAQKIDKENRRLQEMKDQQKSLQRKRKDLQEASKEQRKKLLETYNSIRDDPARVARFTRKLRSQKLDLEALGMKPEAARELEALLEEHYGKEDANSPSRNYSHTHSQSHSTLSSPNKRRTRPKSAGVRRRSSSDHENNDDYSDDYSEEDSDYSDSDGESSLAHARSHGDLHKTGRKKKSKTTKRGRRAKPLRSKSRQRPFTASAARRVKQFRDNHDLAARRRKAGGKGKGGGKVHMSKEEALLLIERMAQDQNTRLLEVLEREQKLETERDDLLAATSNPDERRRLEKIFGIERIKASNMIKSLTHENESTLAREMQRLGLLAGPEPDHNMRYYQ